MQKRYAHFTGVAVLLVVFYATAFVSAQPTQYFRETWQSTGGLPRMLVDNNTGRDFSLTPVGDGTDNTWQVLFPAVAMGTWQISMVGEPISSVALNHSALPAGTPASVNADAGYFRSPLSTSIAADDSWTYTISFKQHFLSVGSTNMPRLYVYLAADGGEATGDAGRPVNGYGLMTFGRTGRPFPESFGAFAVGSTETWVPCLEDDHVAVSGVLYDWTVTFSKGEGTTTLVEYDIQRGGVAYRAGITSVNNAVAPGAMFNRVVIMTRNRARVSLDDITITAGPSTSGGWSFGEANCEFGGIDASFGQVATRQIPIWGSGTIQGIEFSGSSASEFSVVSPALPAVLSGGATPFTLRWAPTVNDGLSLPVRGNFAIFTDSEGTTQALPLLGITPTYSDIRPYVPYAYTDYRLPQAATVANVPKFFPAMLACSPTTTYWAENGSARWGTGLEEADVSIAPSENAVYSYGINAFYGNDAATKLFTGAAGTANAIPRGDVRKAIEDAAHGGVPQVLGWAFRPAGILDANGNLFLAMAANSVFLSTQLFVPSTSGNVMPDALVKAIPNNPANPTTWTFTVLAYEDGLCYPAKIGNEIYMVKSAYQAIPADGGGEIVKASDSTPNPGPATPVAGLGKADFASFLGLPEGGTNFALVSTATDGTNLYVGINNAGGDNTNDLIVKITGLPSAPVINPFITAAMLNGWLAIEGGQFGDFEPDSIAISPSGKYLVVLSQNNVRSNSFLNNGDNHATAREGLMVYDISGGTPVLWDALREDQIVGPTGAAGFMDQLEGDDDSLAVTEVGDDLICFFDTLAYNASSLRGIVKLRLDTQRASITSIVHDGPAQTSATLLNFIVNFDKPILASLASRADFRVVKHSGDLTPTILSVSPKTGSVSSLTVAVSLPGGQVGSLQVQVREDSISLPILWKQKPYTGGQVVGIFSAQARAKEWWLY